MLNPVPKDGVDLCVIVMSEGERNNRRPLGTTETVGHIGIEPHQSGHTVKLTDSLVIHR